MADRYLSRRSFLIGSAAMTASAFAFMTGCTASGSGAAAGSSDAGSSEGGSTEPITMVWLPDNSSADLTASREAIGAAILAACGRDAELMTTTDYNVAIEAIASGQAQMALLGPEGYVQANAQNPAVQAAFTNSDEEGGLEGACYYSRICVKTENTANYADGDTYAIDNIKGGSFSFVSATSTSGFKVLPAPSSATSGWKAPMSCSRAAPSSRRFCSAIPTRVPPSTCWRATATPLRSTTLTWTCTSTLSRARPTQWAPSTR